MEEDVDITISDKPEDDPAFIDVEDKAEEPEEEPEEEAGEEAAPEEEPAEDEEEPLI